MLSDPDREVKNEAATMLSNFLRETKISQVCLLFCHIYFWIIYSIIYSCLASL